MALRGRRNDNFDDISLAACSQGLPIFLSSTSFQKSSNGWPQQHPTERVSNISEKLDFNDLFREKGQVLIILVLEIIQASGSVKVLMK